MPKEREPVAAFFSGWKMVNVSASAGGNTLHCEGRVVDWTCKADPKTPVSFSVSVLKTYRRPRHLKE